MRNLATRKTCTYKSTMRCRRFHAMKHHTMVAWRLCCVCVCHIQMMSRNLHATLLQQPHPVQGGTQMLWKTAKTEANRAEYVLVDTFVSWHMCGWYLVTCDPPKTNHAPSCNGIMDLWSTKTVSIWLEDLTSKLQRSQFYEAMTGFCLQASGSKGSGSVAEVPHLWQQCSWGLISFITCYKSMGRC